LCNTPDTPNNQKQLFGALNLGFRAPKKTHMTIIYAITLRSSVGLSTTLPYHRPRLVCSKPS